MVILGFGSYFIFEIAQNYHGAKSKKWVIFIQKFKMY